MFNNGLVLQVFTLKSHLTLAVQEKQKMEIKRGLHSFRLEPSLVCLGLIKQNKKCAAKNRPKDFFFITLTCVTIKFDVVSRIF